MTAPDIISTIEVAEILGVQPDTVRKYRRRGLLPEPWVVLGSGPIWKREEIEAWNEHERRRQQGGRP